MRGWLAGDFLRYLVKLLNLLSGDESALKIGRVSLHLLGGAVLLEQLHYLNKDVDVRAAERPTDRPTHL